MAENIQALTELNENGLSENEFQAKLYSWFEERGLLSELRSHLRSQMVAALRGTSVGSHLASSSRQSVSPKIQAINLLVAEFLLQQEYHYSLSVLASEVPLLKNLPELSNPGKSTNGKIKRSHFEERDVHDILDALGFSSNADEVKRIIELYEKSDGEALLTCIVRSMPLLPNTKSNIDCKHSTDNSIKSSDSVDSGTFQKPVAKNSVTDQLRLFSSEINHIIKTNFKKPQAEKLREELRRSLEQTLQQIREEEAAKFRHELVAREHRIQEQLLRREEELRLKLVEAETHISAQRKKMDTELQEKEKHLSELAALLKKQHADVSRRQRRVEEQRKKLKQQERDLAAMKSRESIELAEKRSILDVRQQQLNEEIRRLADERKNMTIALHELEMSQKKLQEATNSLNASKSEVMFLKDMENHVQSDHSSLMNVTELKDFTKDKSFVKLAIEKEQKEQMPVNIPSSHEILEQEIKDVLPSASSDKNFVSKGSTLEEENFDPKQKKSFGALVGSQENRIVKADISENHSEEQNLQMQNANFEVVTTGDINLLIQHLQQENTELRSLACRMQARIDELTVRSAQLAGELEDCQTALTLLLNQPAEVDVPTLGNCHQLQPAIPAPPPAPPLPSIPPPTLFSNLVNASTNVSSPHQLGAGELNSFASTVPAVTPPVPPTRPRITPTRELRRKPPRRLVIQSGTSSDEGSPTEEILQEARQRLRRLEEESETVDRNYQEFRLRQLQNRGSASVVLPPPYVRPRLTNPTVNIIPSIRRQLARIYERSNYFERQTQPTPIAYSFLRQDEIRGPVLVSTSGPTFGINFSTSTTTTNNSIVFTQRNDGPILSTVNTAPTQSVRNTNTMKNIHLLPSMKSKSMPKEKEGNGNTCHLKVASNVQPTAMYKAPQVSTLVQGKNILYENKHVIFSNDVVASNSDKQDSTQMRDSQEPEGCSNMISENIDIANPKKDEVSTNHQDDGSHNKEMSAIQTFTIESNVLSAKNQTELSEKSRVAQFTAEDYFKTVNFLENHTPVVTNNLIIAQIKDPIDDISEMKNIESNNVENILNEVQTNEKSQIQKKIINCINDGDEVQYTLNSSTFQENEVMNAAKAVHLLESSFLPNESDDEYLDANPEVELAASEHPLNTTGETTIPLKNLQNITLSSVEVSSDQPISAGEGSAKSLDNSW